MGYTILHRDQLQNMPEGVSKVTAIIDGVKYTKITPKIILNKNIFNKVTDIKYKTPGYILPGINAIDIDWDGASIGDIELSNTSDVLKLLSDIYFDIETQKKYANKYLWEDIITIDENYSAYYEDIDNNIITNMLPFNITNLHPEVIAPKEAHHIGIYDNIGNRIYSLSLNSTYASLENNLSMPIYSVGLISDIHHNDTCGADSILHVNSIGHDNSYKPYEDFEHALKYFNNTNIEFICSAGDITTNNMDHLISFNEHLTKNTVLPLFTCKGNHDNYVSYDNNENWLKYTIPENENVTFFKTGDKTSFYFQKYDDIFIFFNVDYGVKNYNASKTLDGQYNNIPNLTQSTQLYNPDTIKELQQILDIYRNNRCFIFTHLPFPNKAGDNNNSYHNKHNKTYCLNGIQFALLNSLNNYYKNTIWFSGHTHFQWKQQEVSYRANICNWDPLIDYNYNNYNDYTQCPQEYNSTYTTSAYNVHIPSLSRPLISGDPYLIADPGSEAAIMDIYPNGVNIKGIQFADENTLTYSSFEINEKKYVIASDITIDTNCSGYTNEQRIKQLQDYYIELHFGIGNNIDDNFNYRQRFLIKNYISQNIVIEDISVVKITNGNEIDITDMLKSLSDPLIGVYTTNNYYSLCDCVAKIENHQIELGISDNFLHIINSGLPIIVRIKIASVTYKNITNSIAYDDYFVTTANYWLSVPSHTNTNIESKTYEYFLNYIQQYNK